VFSFTVRFTVLRSGFGSGFDVRCSGFEVRVAGSAFDSRCDVSQDLQRVITISSIPWAFRRHSACSTEPHDTRREAVHGFAGLAACDVFKKAIYRLCENKPIADVLGRRKQLKESSSHTTVHIADSVGSIRPTSQSSVPSHDRRWWNRKTTFSISSISDTSAKRAGSNQAEATTNQEPNEERNREPW